MDNAGDSSPYLKYFDRQQNFLLQSTEGSISIQDSGLKVEPIFTEIDGTSGWPVEGLPILLNGSLISEDQPVESAIEELDNNKIALTELYTDSEKLSDNPVLDNVNEVESSVTFPVSEIPGKGFITADGLFLPHELLLQLNLQNGEAQIAEQEILINPKTFSPIRKEIISIDNQAICSSVTNSDTDLIKKKLNLNEIVQDEILNLAKSNGLGEVVQIVNSDGTLMSVNKNLLNGDVTLESSSSTDKQIEEQEEQGADMFDVVMAYKCKKCSFLCESSQNIMQHVKDKHKIVKNISLLKREQSKDMVSVLKPLGWSIFEGNQCNERQNTNFKESKQTVYLCSECDVGYSSREHLKSHMVLTHKLVSLHGLNEDSFVDLDFLKGNDTQNTVQTISDHSNNTQNTKISVCDKNETSNGIITTVNGVNKLSAILVKKQQKLSKKVKCSIKGCDLRFARDDLRIRHEECHVDGQKKQFKCTVCNLKFSVWRVCSLHLWKCHSIDVGLLTCMMCGKFKCLSAMRMITHMAIHNSERPFLCSTCGKTFKQRSQLNNHVIIHRDPEIDKIPKWANQQQCETCEKYFANSKCLKKHIQTVHNKFKPFICNICGHKTARKAMLDLHMRQHTGEKPHHCPVCDYKTGDHNCLRKHIMRHRGDMKYSCPHCDYQAIQSTSYKNHIASKHPGKGGSYYCIKCSYHTVNETTYFAHIRAHEKATKVTENANFAKVNEDAKSKENKDNNVTNESVEIEDEETQNCFLNTTDHSEDAVDTGGITIPAGFELVIK